MFGTIRRHQNWLWVVIIAIIVISFVVFFSPDVNLGGGRGGQSQGQHGTINGQPITDKDFYPAYHEARVNHFSAPVSGQATTRLPRIQSPAMRSPVCS